LRQRGVSYLATGAFATPDLLTFDSLTTLDLKAFTDLGDLFPQDRSLKSTRVTLSVDNLFNERQTVTNTAGATPQAYQPVYRDPIGRTLMVELRKVF
jgi:iron complex outermembrane recepter protein